LIPAIDIGVDVFRVASHVTEANLSAPHIDFLKSRNVMVQGVLMMSHMAPLNDLVAQCKLLDIEYDKLKS
jgi:4-hydroxy 2-oxovalerate aldolase